MWEAAAFFSRQTRGPERRYSATELEALALVEAVRYFGYYLCGRLFTAYTDHKPLCSLLISDRLNGRLRRLGMKLQHLMINIKYLPGDNNGLADALSREERRHETVAKDGLQSSMGGIWRSTLHEQRHLELGQRDCIRQSYDSHFIRGISC